MKEFTALEAVTAIEAGTLTSEKLVRGCLDRIAQRDGIVKAWAHLDPDQAIAQAKAVDATSGGVLRGIPIGVKDIIDTYDMPTGHNSPIFEGKVPFGDAACVALCRTANAVIMGKTVTTEFANRHAGATTNPHDPAHTPGGSSSGSAAAVADGHVPLAFATQTGGSVIRPAAYCGVVGYKPTFGDFSRVGIKMQCHSVDTLGLMARTLDDIALFRAAVLKLPPVRIDRPQQRFQPVFPRDHRLGPPLGLVGQIDVLQRRLGLGPGNRLRQIIGQLALPLDAVDDARPPRLELAQVTQPVGQRAQLGVVQPAGRLFPVARHEGHRRSAVQQIGRGLNLGCTRPDLGGDDAGDARGLVQFRLLSADGSRRRGHWPRRGPAAIIRPGPSVIAASGGNAKTPNVPRTTFASKLLCSKSGSRYTEE